MNIAPWKRRNAPANGELARLRDEMDRTIDRFFHEPLTESAAFREQGWFPPLDMSETDGEVTIRAEVPGIPADELDVSVTDHTLTIAGKKEDETEEQGKNYYQCERHFGSFRRVVELPEAADVDKVSAEADDGVITVRIAKKPDAKPRQVEIKPGAKKRVTVNS